MGRKAKIFDGVNKALLQKFFDYHRENKGVYILFADYCFMMRKMGRERYSAWVIINRIRWEYDIQGGDPFKINNDFIALYARLLISEYPEFEDFFNLRKMKKFNRKISSEEYRRTRGGE